VRDFGGEIPRKDPRLLPDQMAEAAWNVDLSSGPLDGLGVPQLVIDLTATSGAVRKAYRVPGPSAGNPDVWLPLISEYSSVVPSPLANDTLHRVYWTNPPGLGADGAWWNTYARIFAGNTGGNAPYNLGFTTPDPGIVITVTATGGTPATSVPYLERSYLFTYVDQYGLESSPCTPSLVVAGAGDGTWTVHGLPTSAPSSPVGYHFPTVVAMRIYRTITGATSGADFYKVIDIGFGSSTYVDPSGDVTVVNNLTLTTASWASPPTQLDGLTALPGGMLVGFTGNTIHFCEPDMPHAWPAGYDQSLLYQILGFGVWQNSLIVLTSGVPSSGAGANPSNFTFSQVQVPEPCISRGSIITDLMGVYYASQNGLVMLNYFGMQNQTLSNFTKNIWLEDFNAASIIACRHRAQYLAMDGTGTGFLIDYTEPRMGVAKLNPFQGVVSVWNDSYNGNTYVCASKKVYLWDSPTAPSLVFRWRSKRFFFAGPYNFGAAQIEVDSTILTATAASNPLDNNDTTLQLPNGINAVFRVLVERGGVMSLVAEFNLTEPRSFLRLPSGFREFTWQFEIVSRVPVFSVEIARTMRELGEVPAGQSA
jgi:hypothetical protein